MQAPGRQEGRAVSNVERGAAMMRDYRRATLNLTVMIPPGGDHNER